LHKIHEMIKTKEEKNNRIWPSTIFIVVMVCIIYIAGMYFINTHFDSPANIGNSSGAISALFSALAFAGIFITIRLQHKELDFQKEELTLTRNELEGQKEEFKIQNNTLKIQRFENTFFQLLTLHHQIVNSIQYIQKYDRNITKLSGRMLSEQITRGNERTIEDAERLISGRHVFQLRYELLKKDIESIFSRKDINKEYYKHYEDFQNDAGHYFRNLYRIIKLVDNSNFTFEENYSYTSIVRAQLSDYELLWLFYNCLSENGEEKFKPLIEKYSLFKNIPTDKLANSEHVQLYNTSAIKRSI